MSRAVGGPSLRKLVAGLVLGAVASTLWAQVDPNRVVFVVNGEEIKGAEYYRRMEYLPGAGKMLGDRFAEMPPGFMTIETMITERLVYQLAKQQHCMPTDDEVKAELERAKLDNPKIEDDWLASGRLIEDLLNQYRFELAQFKLATIGTIITDTQVDDHYKKYPTEFTIPKQLKLRVIAVDSSEKKDEVDKALAAGTSFADAASKFSVDVTRIDGGLYGIVPEDGVKEPAKSALEGLAVGKATDWLPVKDQPLFLKFYKEDVYPAKLLPLDARLRETTRRRLMLETANDKKTNNVAKMMADMRRNAQIDIKQKDFAAAYDKFIKNYLKQQDAKTGAGN